MRLKKMEKAFVPVLLFCFLVSCSTQSEGFATAAIQVRETPSKVQAKPTITEAVPPTQTLTPTSSVTPDTRIPPEQWHDWPVLPIVQPEMLVVYQRGVKIGNKPTVFIKIGDGEISTLWFLTQYDLEPENYHLGGYTNLQGVIGQFQGSFAHVGLAAGRGFTTTIILGPAPEGSPGCKTGESRLACEISTQRPVFALISLGTNQVWEPDIFDAGLREIVASLLNADVIPILATKADNLEGDERINTIIAKTAYEYDLPLWNFWRAVQGLPEHGLQADHEHLTYAYSDFNNPVNFQYAWPWRNLTALQTLDTVNRVVSANP